MTTHTLRVALSLSLLSLVAGCGSSGEPDLTEPYGPRMRPGENCLACHSDPPLRADAVSPSGRKAPVWTAAGTVFEGPTSTKGLAGVEVVLTGLDGAEIVLVTNAVGNFYTKKPIDPKKGPRLRYQGRTAQMKRELPDVPACNACHSNPPLDVGKEGPEEDPPGRLYVP